MRHKLVGSKLYDDWIMKNAYVAANLLKHATLKRQELVLYKWLNSSVQPKLHPSIYTGCVKHQCIYTHRLGRYVPLLPK